MKSPTSVAASNTVSNMEDADDTEAKKLMEEWGVALPNDDDLSVDEDEEDNKISSIDPALIMQDEATLDHVILGVCDLDEAIQDFKKLTGVEPVRVTSHRGLGTKGARVTFKGGSSFLEIIAPDPKQSKEDSSRLATYLAELKPGDFVPVHYVVRKNDMLEHESEYKAMGLDCDHITMFASGHNGGMWKWEVFSFGEHDEGGMVPLFVKWNDAKSMEDSFKGVPIVGKLEQVTIRAPSDSYALKLLEDVEGITTLSGSDTLLEFTIATPNMGTHTFSSASPKGLHFPEGRIAGQGK